MWGISFGHPKPSPSTQLSPGLQGTSSPVGIKQRSPREALFGGSCPLLLVCRGHLQSECRLLAFFPILKASAAVSWGELGCG